jgi:hypothetical protein
MAEFCPTCPVKGFCVGEAVAMVTVPALQGSSYEGNYMSVRVVFTDEDGAQSSIRSTRTEGAAFDESKLPDLEKKFETRVDKCNGSPGKDCPALGDAAMKQVVKVVMGPSEADETAEVIAREAKEII